MKKSTNVKKENIPTPKSNITTKGQKKRITHIMATGKNTKTKNKKSFNKTPGKSLKSTDNYKIKNKTDEEICPPLKDKNLLNQRITQFQPKKNNLLLEPIKINNISNKNDEDINTNLNINNTINMNSNSNSRNNNINDFQLDLYEKSDILIQTSNNNSFLYNSVNSIKNFDKNIEVKYINKTSKKERNTK